MKATHRDISRDNPHIRFELLDCPDCIYLNEHGRCTLKKDRCEGNGCQEQRSFSSDTNAREKWKRRLSDLPEMRQKEIAGKYYGGKYPWREKENDK